MTVTAWWRGDYDWWVGRDGVTEALVYWWPAVATQHNAWPVHWLKTQWPWSKTVPAAWNWPTGDFIGWRQQRRQPDSGNYCNEVPVLRLKNIITAWLWPKHWLRKRSWSIGCKLTGRLPVADNWWLETRYWAWPDSRKEKWWVVFDRWWAMKLVFCETVTTDGKPWYRLLADEGRKEPNWRHLYRAGKLLEILIPGWAVPMTVLLPNWQQATKQAMLPVLPWYAWRRGISYSSVVNTVTVMMMRMSRGDNFSMWWWALTVVFCQWRWWCCMEELY